MPRKLWLAVPLMIFALFVLAVGWRLSAPPDTTIRSRLVGQQMPAVDLTPAVPGKAGFKTSDLGGRARIINLFASWCVPCIAEAPVLGELRKRGVIIDGIAIRDSSEDLAKFLEENGDPYERIGADPRSQVQMALGSSGVPESFIVDRSGVIRYQHVGPIMPQDVDMVLAELERAR